MQLLGTLRMLHQNLTLLIETLRQEQKILLLPQNEDVENAELLHRLAQDKQQYFRVLERFSAQSDDLQQVLVNIGAAVPTMDERARCLSLWREIDELVVQAVRVDQLNGTLVRQRFNHNQLVLAGLRQIK